MLNFFKTKFALLWTDIKNIDWVALSKSRGVWAGFVATGSSYLAMTGHSIPSDQQTAIVDFLTKACDVIAGISAAYGMWCRIFTKQTIVKTDGTGK